MAVKMINERYVKMLESKDVIFEIFAYATKRRKEAGEENVFDFSLGNPSVPAPWEVRQALISEVTETDPLSLHSYSPAGGLPKVRQTIAEDLNARYGFSYEGKHIFMTCGAAAALAHAIRAVTEPGDAVLTFAPCFSEYFPYVEGAGCHLKVVPPDTDSFQIDFEKTGKMLTRDVAAVLINSPNNPSGVVYSTMTIRSLAALMKKAADKYGHPIYLISDEPYRDIVFSGTDSPVIGREYPDTITCYSYSKSLSLPGERIGYAAVNPEAEGADQILAVLPQISRTIGHNGAPVLWQRVAAANCMRTSDLSVYEKNAGILYEALMKYGYTVVKPGGTFYLFPRSPLPDAGAFCKKAMEQDLMLVPGDGFGCPGHFRIACCVPTERVERSLEIFKRLADG